MAKNPIEQVVTELRLGANGIVTVIGTNTYRQGPTTLSSAFANSYNPRDDISDLPQKTQDAILLWLDDEVKTAFEDLIKASTEV